MHPILVKVLPASVRRGYYEFVDYLLPEWLNYHRWLYKIKYALSPSFRAEQRRMMEMIGQLDKALTAGYQLAGAGEPLVIEDLSCTMKLVTFDESRLKLQKGDHEKAYFSSGKRRL